MLEDINLKAFKKEAAVYYFESNNKIIYVGSSNNLYERIRHHKQCIEKGINAEHNPTLYEFLKSNQFTIHFAYTDDYRQLEQDLIEKYNPKYNRLRAYTGCGTFKGREAEWQKEYNEKFKEQINKHQKQYNNQLCSYNGETLSLGALSKRFKRKGVEHYVLEAKKYLIK